MKALAWLLLIIGGIIVRQVTVGRVKETPQDLRDMFFSVVTGNWDETKKVFDRSSTSTGPEQVNDEGKRLAETVGGSLADAAITGTAEGIAGATVGQQKGMSVLAEMRRLGSKAKGYRWGATGPTYYDCSGLVWKAMRNVGAYKGPRFTTLTWIALGPRIATKLNAPEVGAIVVWQRGGGKGHMGVISGPDRFYAAQSTKTGIKEAKTSAISGSVSYWRLK